MENQLRVLVVQQADLDVEFMRNEMQKAGVDLSLSHVESEDELEREVTDRPPDLVISHSPDSPAATLNLATLQRIAPAIPVVAVTASEKAPSDCVLDGPLVKLWPLVKASMRKKSKKTRPKQSAEQTPASDARTRELSEALEALRESERRYRLVVENVKEVIFQTNAEGLWTFLNPAWTEVTGFGVDESLGVVFLEFVHPDDRQHNLELFEPLIRREKDHCRHEIRYLHKDGGFRWIEVFARLTLDEHDKIIGTSGTLNDVTERRQAEDALRQSEARYRAVVEDQTELICRFTPDLKLTFVNDAYCRYFDKSREELIGRDIISFAYEEDRDMCGAYGMSFGRDKPYGTIEHRVRLANEEVRWMQWTDRAITNENGEIIEFQSVGRDITDHKLAEEAVARARDELEVRVRERTADLEKANEALRQSERNYRELVENAQGGVWSLDRKGNTTFVNSRMAEMLGYTVDEMMGASVFSFMESRNAETLKKRLSARRKGVKDIFDNELIRKDGERIYVIVQGWRVYDARGKHKGSTAFMVDTTEQRQLEQQLRQSQRLEAIGTLTGGIAHEFKNLLMGVSGYSELLQIKLGFDHPQNVVINDLLHCVDRASKLIGQLLAFSRSQVLDPQPTELNALVSESKTLVERLLGEHISIEWNLSPEAGTVEVDPGQIEQVLINLVINARDAMPQGGKLTISTGARRIEPGDEINKTQGIPGSYAELVVTDTGTGMDAETAERIFEPFFTTKEDRKNTGLGLSVAYGIIKQHKGYISVTSEPGNGTSFRTLLPRNSTEVGAPLEKVGTGAIGGGETILLAEDEDSVRLPAVSVLEGYGYKVISATDGEQAAEMFERYADEIDLVIVDLVMPKAGGKQVWDAIRCRRPDVKVLFTSGYTAATVHQDFSPPPGVPFLSKPFSLFHLAQKVRDMLG